MINEGGSGYYRNDYPTPLPHPVCKRLWGFLLAFALVLTDLGPDLHVHGLLQPDRSDDKGNAGNDHRIPKSGIDIAGRLARIEPNQWHEAAKDSVSNMIWKRHGRIPDPGWECLHQV